MRRALPVLLCAAALAAGATVRAGVTGYADPFVGTAFTGHTFPAVCVPFGLVQAGPDTGNGDWHHCAGYRHEETTLCGFSQTHLNGTGVGDLGDVLLLPFAGERPPESHVIDKNSEKASPGYYAVEFDGRRFRAEISATEHCAIYRFTGPADGRLRLLYDGQWVLHSRDALSNLVLRAAVEPAADRRGFAGTRTTKAWVERDLGFAVRFDRPFAAVEKFLRRPADRAESLVFTFDLPPGEALTVKVGLSASGKTDAARKNLDAEIPDFDFNRVRASAAQRWETLLARVEVAGTDPMKRNLYTALYHLFTQPNNIADAGEKPFYSTFSCWDTFRAAHPLYTILCPERVPDMVASLLEQGRRTGFLPVWTLWGRENQCMIGTHSIPIIVDAFLKRDLPGLEGLKHLDWRAAYAQVRETLTAKHEGRKKEDWDLLDRLGYYPTDKLWRESVSRTMECCYDDACAARMAEALGFADDAAFFRRRANNWKNVFDPALRLVRPRHSNGQWVPFDPYEIRYGNDYTEGNAFQYTWHVMQDPEALIAALGGREAALERLDALFAMKGADAGGKVLDITGSIGQYVHGNEPSHHVIYFYSLLGRRDKAAAKVAEVFERFYLPKPDGLCGNDDCGQMSAWYVFSAMGFYPFDPCGGRYVLGAPQFDRIRIRTQAGTGPIFTVESRGQTPGNGGQAPVARGQAPFITHADITKGGLLVLEKTAPRETRDADLIRD